MTASAHPERTGAPAPTAADTLRTRLAPLAPAVLELDDESADDSADE